MGVLRVPVGGLNYLLGEIDGAVAEVRWNDEPGQIAAIVMHRGGGGLTWGDIPRDDGPDPTGWEDLTSRGLRLIGIRWIDNGIAPPSTPEPGWWSRRGPGPEGFVRLTQRPAGAFVWMAENLMQGMTQGFMGGSGGAAAVMGLVIHGNEHRLDPEYLGILSTAPFWDAAAACLGTTPPGTYVDEATGALGATGESASLRDCETKGWADHVWALPNGTCAAQATGPDLLGDFGDACWGRQFTGRAHIEVAPVAEGGICGGDDSYMGITWVQGQIFNLPVWSDAVWNVCNGPHGSGTRTEHPCFDFTHAQIVAALGLGSPPDPPDPPDPPGPPAVLLSVADAGVTKAQPSRNSGTADDVSTRDEASDKTAHAWLRFDLSGVASVSSALLRVRRTDDASIYNQQTECDVFEASSAWGEATITWDTEPALGGSLGSGLETSASEWLELEVTGYVSTALGGLVSFTIAGGDPSVDSWAGWDTRESANPPQLIIED